ncbi:hypothetical protein P8452_42239 [Trifolium repens]|nr:hypothetical protein P8452_42239 [Trifolium repens]
MSCSCRSHIHSCLKRNSPCPSDNPPHGNMGYHFLFTGEACFGLDQVVCYFTISSFGGLIVVSIRLSSSIFS